MAALHRQLVLSMNDMRYVSVECANCGSSLTLDMTSESEHQNRFGFTPAVCSVCQKPHDTSIQHLNAFRHAYRLLLPVAGRITFRGEVESAEPSSSASRASDGKD
jgi:hypothetical protein